MKRSFWPVAMSAALAGACQAHDRVVEHPVTNERMGEVHTVAARPFPSSFSAAGTAEPISQATLSTKLMGSVEAVFVREGDAIVAGQPLIRIDARDLAAKAAQIQAGIAEAEAMQREAASQAVRMRALYAQDAAPKAQLEAAETGLARAEAAVRAAHANARELDAARQYAVIRAPADGLVVRRFVDPGAFAAPGTPLIAVQNASKLRIRVSATPDAARTVRPGARVQASIESLETAAVIEGIVPAATGNTYVINAIVDNGDGRFLPGSAATIRLPLGQRTAVMLPTAALVREGDLTGAYVKSGDGFAIRWIRIGEQGPHDIEVLSGLKPGEQVLVQHEIAGAQ